MEAELNVLVDLSVCIAKAHTNFKKSPKERVTVSYVETRLESLESLWEKFSTRHHELIRRFSQDDLAKSVYGTQSVYDVTDDNYMDYKCHLKSVLSRLQPKSSCSDTSVAIANTSSSKSSHVNLPKISIPVFSGLYTEWMSFRDLFISLIHDNNDIDDVQKLHYLKGHLKGEAEQLLRHIPITNDSYEQCWALLKKRYNNKQYLVNCILKRFFSQKSISTESSSAIKQLLDVTIETLNALKGLGIDTGTWDVMIIYIVSQRLDSESRKQWESKVSELSRSDMLPNMSQFQEFLETKYHSLEFLDSKPNSSHVQKQRTYTYDHTHSNQSSKPNPIHMLHVAQLSCVYCKQDHNLRSCKDFINTDLNSKRNFVQSHGLCFNCLGHHSVKHCRNTSSCQICNRRHHSLLHPRGELQSADSNESVNNQVAPLESHAHTLKVSPQEERLSTSKNITNHFVKRVAPQVLLATAIVKAESQNGGEHQLLRALIDQGSEASFITKAAVQSLGLYTTPTKGLISGLGGEQSLIARSMVEIVISSRLNSGCVYHVSAYVLDKLTTYLPATAASITSWPELERVSLADPEYHSPNKIDILLGAEVYSRIIDNGIIKCPSGSLVAQNTTLGWILSGRMEPRQLTPISNIATMHARVERVTQLPRSFFEIKAEPSDKQNILSANEQLCEDGQCVIKLGRQHVPAIMDGESQRDIVQKRFHYTGRKQQQKDEHLKKEYNKSFDERLEINHAKEIYNNMAARSSASYRAVKDILVASEKKQNGFYKDDFMGCESEVEAIEKYKQSNERQRGLQKWYSNEEAILNQIQKENFENQEVKTIDVEPEAMNKILGLSSDEFTYIIQLLPMSAPVTVRKISTNISKLNDLKGRIASNIIQAKLFIQNLWNPGIRWNKRLSPTSLYEWLKYRECVLNNTLFRLKHWIYYKSNPMLFELHSFSGVSNFACSNGIHTGDIRRRGYSYLRI